MAIGIVNDDDLFAELAKLNPSLTRNSLRSDIIEPIRTPESGTIIEPLPSRGRSIGDNNVPESLRKIIGEDSVINGRASAIQIAEQFGISSSSVSAYAKGATSTASYNSPSKEILSHINRSRERAIKKSSRVLNAALSAITQEKLDYTDASDLSGIAKDMSVIIKNLEPPASQGNEEITRAPQFVIFAPTFRDERTYESITVQE